MTQLPRRVTKVLCQRGLEDAEARVDDGLDALRLESLQHSMALGTARPRVEAEVRPHHRRVAVAEGISLHADTAVHANDRQGRRTRAAMLGRKESNLQPSASEAAALPVAPLPNAGAEGLEPSAHRFKGGRSTVELRPNERVAGIEPARVRVEA